MSANPGFQLTTIKAISSTKTIGKRMTKSTTPNTKEILNENQKRKTDVLKGDGGKRSREMRGDLTGK